MMVLAVSMIVLMVVPSQLEWMAQATMLAMATTMAMARTTLSSFFIWFLLFTTKLYQKTRENFTQVKTD